jgi:hypothetical protein
MQEKIAVSDGCSKQQGGSLRKKRTLIKWRDAIKLLRTIAGNQRFGIKDRVKFTFGEKG